MTAGRPAPGVTLPLIAFIVLFSSAERAGAAVTKYLKSRKFILSLSGDQKPEVKVSQGRAPSRGCRGGSFPPLPASGGSRRPWACGRVPPVSASVFPGLLLCVCVSPLLCLVRTLPLDVGPPSSRRSSSQTLPCITSAKTLFPHKVPLSGFGGT